jgi:hypothetical protein
MQNMIKALTAECEQLRAVSAKHKTIAAELTTQKNALQKRLSADKAACEMAKKQAADAQKDNEALKADLGRMLNQLHRQHDDAQRATQELQTVKEDHRKLASLLEAEQRRVRTLQDEINACLFANR